MAYGWLITTAQYVDEWGMLHALDTRELFWWVDIRERNHTDVVEVEKKIIIK